MALYGTTPAGIEVLNCGYWAVCQDRKCDERATVTLRYLDDQSRPIRQEDYCRRHGEHVIRLSAKLRVLDTRMQK
jgi:hypothetical protein